MNTTLNTPRQGVLYPLLVMAAISVILLSGLGIAATLGLLPSAHSVTGLDGLTPPDTQSSQGAATLAMAPAGRPETASAMAHRTRADHCAGCGTVTRIVPYQAAGQPSGMGAVAGGVVGGLLGNQIGHGGGRALATVAGLGGGAYVGHRIEQNMNTTTRYRIVVRMDDGTRRTFHQSNAPWSVGERVRESGGLLESLVPESAG